MARLLLRVPHRGHEAGEIIEVDSRRASTLVLEKVGVLAPPKPPSTAIERLREILLQFRVGLDSLDIPEKDQEEVKALLRNAIVPILPAFVQTMTPEEFNASQADAGGGESQPETGENNPESTGDVSTGDQTLSDPPQAETSGGQGQAAIAGEGQEEAKAAPAPEPITAKPEPKSAKPAAKTAAKSASAKKPQGKK